MRFILPFLLLLQTISGFGQNANTSSFQASFPSNPYPFLQFPGERLPNFRAFSNMNLRFEDKPILTSSGKIYFSARRTGFSETGLWETDGTVGGTTLIKSVAWDDQTFLPRRFTEYNGLVYFTATNGTSGFELWRTDGTEEGTFIVTEITPGNNTTPQTEPQHLTVAGGQLFFTLNRDLWATDGTANGTRLVKANCFDYGTVGVTEFSFIAYNNKLYFTGHDPAANNELWTSDGTEAGTLRVADLAPGTASLLPGQYVIMGGQLFFLTVTGLWRSDGTTAGTALVKSFTVISRSSNWGKPTLFVHEQALYFSATLGSSNNYELWKSDGTEAGTVMVRDINPGASASSFPDAFTSYNGLLYFSAQSPGTGYELWKSDGTSEGTAMVRDIFPGTASSSCSDFQVFKGMLVFAASSSSGRELWKTDGTAANTVLLKDIAAAYPGASTNSSNPLSLLELENTLFFIADDGLRGFEWWKSDGTEAGTTIFVDLNQLTQGITGPLLPETTPVPQIAYADGAVYFLANSFDPLTGATTQQMFKTYGLDNTTVRVPNTENAQGLFAFNDWVYFIRSTGYLGQLLKTNGDMVITLPATVSQPQGMTAAGPYLYFFNVNNILCRTDGTAAGTIELGVKGDNSWNAMVAVGSTLFFPGWTGSSVSNVELWRSNGTPATTVRVKDIAPGTLSSNPYRFVRFQNKVCFQTNIGGNGQSGSGTWISDGTESGTFRLGPIWSPIASSDKYLFGKIVTGGTRGSEELWRCDGTVAGFTRVKILNENGCGSPISDDLFYLRTAAIESVVYFVADYCSKGLELWRTNGTEAGTYLLKDIDATQSGWASEIGSMRTVGSSLCFAANNNINGKELWRSDGTAACTHMVADLAPFRSGSFPMSSNPGSTLVTPDQVLYFVGQTLDYGTVLFKYNPALPVNKNGFFYFTGTGSWSQSENWCEGTLPPAVLRSGSSIVVEPSNGTPVILDRPQIIKQGAELKLSPQTNLIIQGSLNVIKRD